jgi:CRP-like cAMP-binding protein
MHEEKVKFLQDVNVRNKRFKDYFQRDQLDNIAQLMKLENYIKGQVIIREGEVGDTFYMIHSGEVAIYKKAVGEKPIGTIGKQKYFGEKALLSDDVRAATCKAATPLTCYTLSRNDFNRVMGSLRDLFDQNSHSPERNTEISKTITRKNKVRYQLGDLNLLGVLGQGAFGKVRLAKAKATGKYYALKIQVSDNVVHH